MFGPKSPAERAGPRDSVISWANYEPAGGYCQNVYFGHASPLKGSVNDIVMFLPNPLVPPAWAEGKRDDLQYSI